jgi:hypothetical protein
MPFGTPDPGLNTAQYNMSARHVLDQSVPIVITVFMGDSGATVEDADSIFQAVVDAFDANPDFVLQNATKHYPVNIEVTPT